MDYILENMPGAELIEGLPELVKQSQNFHELITE